MTFEYDFGTDLDCPDGEYWLEVRDAHEFTTRNSTPAVFLDLAIVDHPEHAGVRVIDTLHFTERAFWRVKKFYLTLGMPLPDGIVAVDPAAWFEQRFRGKVNHKHIDGVSTLVVADYVIQKPTP